MHNLLFPHNRFYFSEVHYTILKTMSVIFIIFWNFSVDEREIKYSYISVYEKYNNPSNVRNAKKYATPWEIWNIFDEYKFIDISYNLVNNYSYIEMEQL